jgi:hypothetical protein
LSSLSLSPECSRGPIGLVGLASDIVVDHRMIFRIRTRQGRIDYPEALSCDQENAIAV